MVSKIISSILLISMAWNCHSLAQTCSTVVSPDNVTVTPKVVVISGTNRAGANTLKVAKQVSEIYQRLGAEVTLLNLMDVKQNVYKPENYWNTPLSFQKQFDAPLNASDSVVFVFPEYNGNFAGALGIFMNYIQTSFQGKPVGFIGVSEGILGGQKGAEALGITLRHMKADIISEAQVNIPSVKTVMESDRVIEKSLVSRLEKSAMAIIQRVKDKKQGQSQRNEMLQIVKGQNNVLTFQMNSGLQVRGQLIEVRADKSGKPYFLKWSGPTEMKNEGQTIDGQGVERHRTGFSTPIGTIQTSKGPKSLSNIKSMEQLATLGLVVDQRAVLKYTSGIVVEGVFKSAIFSSDGHLQLLTFEDTTATFKEEKLYKPSWGPFDLAVGENVDLIHR